MNMSATHSIAPKLPALRRAITTRRFRSKGTTFTHDARNRLTKAVKADGTTMAYVYAVDGLRIESVKNPSNALRAVGCTLGCTIFDQALALKVGLVGNRKWNTL
jgi:YD repeat-containing protein